MTLRFDALADQLVKQLNWLTDHSAGVATAESPIWEAWWEAVESIATQSNAEVDAAARLLANGELTTPPAPETCACLMLRVGIAIDLLYSLEGNDNVESVVVFPKAADAMTETELKSWLLVDFWNGVGRYIWQRVGYWQFDLFRASQPPPATPEKDNSHLN